ncbi:hypothetical protein ACV367_33565, partial [Pseudomonas aeruginosa]
LDSLLGAVLLVLDQQFLAARPGVVVPGAEQDGLQNEQRGGTQELMRLEREIAGIQRWLGELSVLKTRFALVDDAKVLEQ